LGSELSSAVAAGALEEHLFDKVDAQLKKLSTAITQTASDQNYCSADAVKDLAKRKNAAAEIDQLKRNMVAAQAAYNAARKPSDGSDPDGDAVAVAKQLLEEEKKKLQKAEDNLSRLIAAKLKVGTSRSFIPQVGQLNYDVKPTIQILRKWFQPARFLRPDSRLEKALTLLRAEIEPATSSNVANMKSVPTFKGIYYRVPRPAKVTILRLGNPSDVLAKKPPIFEITAFSKQALFRQFGVVAALEIQNGIFQSNKYVVNFTEDGLLSSFEYEERNARIVEAIGAAKGVLDEKDDAAVEAIDRDTKLLEAERKRLEEQKKLLNARKALVGIE
jgi:hypothetical protein